MQASKIIAYHILINLMRCLQLILYQMNGHTYVIQNIFLIFNFRSTQGAELEKL